MMSTVLTLPTAARATDIYSAEQAGMGGAAIADPRDINTILVSPASMAFIERYDVGAYFVGGPDGDLRWHVSAVDGRTNDRVVFGLGYTGGLINPAFHPNELPGWIAAGEALRNAQQRHDISLALGIPFLDRRLTIGANGTVRIFDGKFIGSGATGNMDLAIATRPVEWVSVGITASDILPVPDQASDPTQIAIGVRGGWEKHIVGAVDFGARLEEVVESPFWVRFGIEGGIKWARLRAGYDWDGERGTHRVAAGLGLTTPVGTLDYAIQIPIVTQDFDPASMTHTVSLVVYTNFGDREREEEPIRWKDGS